MTKRMKGSSRVLSFVLALCLIAGMLPMMAPTADAAYNTNNAPLASAEKLKTYENTYAVTPNGGVLRVIDGKLWVWGSNANYGLGLNTYNNADAKETTNVLEPIEHDFDFGSPIVKVIAGYKNSVAVLTEAGEVYTWGTQMCHYLFNDSGVSGNGYVGKTPIKWDPANITALDDVLDEEGNPRDESETKEKRKIVDIQFGTLSVYATDSDGEIWVAGTSNSRWSIVHMVDGMTGATNRLFRPLSETFINKLQDSYNPETKLVEDETEQVGRENRRTVTKMIPSYLGGSTFIYTAESDGTEGPLFAMGVNNGGQNLLPQSSATMPVKVLDYEFGAPLKEMGVDMNTLQTSGYNTSFIDPKGNVWMVGGREQTQKNDYLFPSAESMRVPTMVYNAEMKGPKAVKVFTAEKTAVFLTADNALYAIGVNTNGFIDSTKGTTAVIEDAKPVFTEISKTNTIVGVYPTNLGVMVLTESGDQYWTGSNASGTMGNGTTESPAAGSVSESTQATIPPVAPTSSNEIIFEIEDHEGNTYISAVDENGGEYILKNRGEDDESSVTDMTLEAGKIFKLNVYFKDFQKINNFVVPIRFNPNYIKVVNGSGEPYAENAVVSPGAIGESVGIVKGFTAQTYPNGTLIGDGVQQGGYPKICNTNGWVSVAGFADPKSQINGEQLMFSVYFTVMKQTDDGDFTYFDIARESDTSTSVGFAFNPNVPYFDSTGSDADDRGAGWTVTNTVNPEKNGKFAFESAVDTWFPPIQTSFTGFNTITLSIYDANDKPYTEVTPSSGTGGYTGTLISKDNTSTIYTIKATPDTDASFPQVTWTKSLTSQQDPTVTDIFDFITIVEETDTYIRFKLPDGYARQDIGAITFTSTSVNTNNAGEHYVDDITIVIATMTAPKSIVIAEKADYPNGVIYYSVTENDAPTLFTATFPGEAQGFTATGVVWKLFDDEGNELEPMGADNTVHLRSTNPGTGSIGGEGYSDPTATVAPVHTTFNDDFVVLRVESVYDPNVYDEIKIRVHLRVTKLTFSQTQLRLPTNTSRDLSTLLSIAPENDYYEAQLEWTYHPKDPSNPYLIFDGTSVVSAGSKANASDTNLEYDTIKVTDKLSGGTVFAIIEIAVISVDSPIKPNQVEVYNLAGGKGDIIYIKSGLQEGDIVTFYKTYGSNKTTGVEGKDYFVRGPLKAEHVPFYKFPAEEDFLAREGGEIAISIQRAGGEEKDKIPVPYDPEPSKVYGYISLSGKDASSARNEGISVQLINGPSNPGIVYTDNTGYFEFETYIQPGTYSLVVYHDNYLRRIIQPDEQAGYAGIVVPSVEKFAISTEDSPIILYPGDVNVDGAINRTDINYYVRYWVGQYNTSLAQFANFDFYDGAQQVIDLNDLDMVLGRSGWVSESYPKWYVPAQK